MAKSPNSTHPSLNTIIFSINKYKADKEEEADRRRREEEESKMPPGTRLMSEEERVRTLEELQMSKREINNMLERLPIA